MKIVNENNIIGSDCENLPGELACASTGLHLQQFENGVSYYMESKEIDFLGCISKHTPLTIAS